MLGPNHPEVGRPLKNLAEVYRAQGRYTEAEPLYKRSLVIRETALGPEHLEVGSALSNLGLLYDTQGRYAEADPLHKRSLYILEKVLGPNHPDVATSLNNLALLPRKAGTLRGGRALVQAQPRDLREVAWPRAPSRGSVTRQLGPPLHQPGALR